MKIASLAKLVAWSIIAAIVFVTVCPIGLRPVTETTVNMDRGLSFVVAGIAFALAYPRRWWLLLVLLPVTAFGIEALQFLSPSRHPQLPDATFKAVGAFVGVLCGGLATGWARSRFRRLRPSN